MKREAKDIVKIFAKYLIKDGYPKIQGTLRAKQ